jgi:25S rRNA (adenine2142-N1)-methyltransferase
MAGKKRKAIPLAPPPITIGGSRKRARQVTTLFHKYTRQRDEAAANNVGEVQERMDALIEQLGGRREYQRASQISTSFHSTSKWVLGCLARSGWLFGIAESDDRSSGDSNCQRRAERRPTRLLEVGAINTELLDAATAKDTTPGSDSDKTKYRMQVRAIDLHSMHDGIEEADFLQLKVPSEDVTRRYDVIVCSMVLNCVTTPKARGEMMCRLFHFLRPGGQVYMTVPKTCLNLSPYMDDRRFEELCKAVGFDVLPHSKDSPKVAFFICSRPVVPSSTPPAKVDSKFTKLVTIRRGKKYRNDFAITLADDSVAGRTLEYEWAETEPCV